LGRKQQLKNSPHGYLDRVERLRESDQQDHESLKRYVGHGISRSTKFYKTKNPSEEKCSLRPGQLNGLPTRNNKKWFVDLFVSLQNMFRPSPDPEISDTQAQISFPENVSMEHINWINN